MKNLVLFVTVIFFNLQFVSGQIKEGQNNMSLGVQNSLETVLEGVTVNEAVKLWTDHMKQYGSVKRNKKADEYFTTGVKIGQISQSSKVDVYARFTERGSNSTMLIWVDLGTAFIGSKENPKEYDGLMDFMKDFKLQATKFAIQKELDQTDKDLKKMQKELEGLYKDNQKMHDDIKKAEERIAKAKEDIKTNLKDQEGKKLEIDKQMELLKSTQKKMDALGKK